MGMGPRLRYQHTGFGRQNSGRGPTRTPGVFPGNQRPERGPWKTSRKRVRILRAFGDFKGLERSKNRYAKLCAQRRVV